MAQTFKAWIGKDLDEHGMAWAVLVRERDAGRCELGAFLVDAWCLGVKDAYYDEVPAEDVQEFVDDQLPADARNDAEPACVRALVEGAVEYAQSLGFLPHRDYRKARKVFGSLKSADCPHTFTFGRDGRPCFMPGPDDDEARINRVLAVLTARVGAEGFDFIDPAGDVAAEDEVIEALYLFIEDGRCPDRAYSGYEAYGFLTGTCLLPEAVEPDAWPVAFWGGETAIPTFRDAAEAEAITRAILALRERIARDLEDGEYEIGLPEVGDKDRERFARRSCVGFLRGLGLAPKMLAWLRGHPDGAAAVALVERAACGEGAVGESFEDDLIEAICRLDDLAAELLPDSGPASGK